MKETRYLIKIIATERGVKEVKKHLKDIQGVVKSSSTHLTEATGKQNDFVKALRRVAIVVPVWFLFRQAMMGVLQTIREGLQYWEDFERAMIKARQVIHGTVGDMEKTVQGLTETIKMLAEETGKPMNELTESFYKFGTAGIDVERSQEGMSEATKLSILMQGDAVKTAEMLASTYRLLGDSMSDTVPAHLRIATIGAQIREMWTNNIFELDGFNQSMQRFLATAKIYNVQMDEMIALMATLNTASIKNSRAGRLLSSSLDRMMGNLDKVARMFNIKYNPATDDAFKVLMQVLSAIKELEKQGAGAKVISEAFEVMGGVRMRRPGKALVSVYELLIQNLSNANIQQGRYNELIGKMNEAYRESLDTIPVQIDRMKTLRKHVGQAFVQGIVGGEEFTESLKRINEALQATEKIAGYLGKRLKEAFKLSIPGLSELMWLYGKLRKDLEEGAELTIKTPSEAEMKRTLTVVQRELKKQLGVDIKFDITQFRTEEQLKGVKALIKHEVDLLKARGASEETLLRTQMYLEDQLNIEQEGLSPLKRRLDLEKAIVQEKLKQNKYSSETIKLYRIAMKYGTDIARDIGRVLTGQMRIETLDRGAGQVFKEEFGGRYEQYQAQKFFEREGRGIPIPEAVRPTQTELYDMIRRIRMEERRDKEKPVPITLNQNVDVQIDLDGKPIEGKTRIVIKNDIEDPNSVLSKGIEKKIEEY